MKLAYCGDNCEECPRYIATITEKRENLKKAALLMKKVGWPYNLRDLEQMKCQGCQDMETCEYKIKDCCIGREIENCGNCVDYPCQKIKNAFHITEVNSRNFKDILTKDEYTMFQKAFFEKKLNLDKEHKLNFS
ncbi:MAG: DUF3795 domain-containing protein [Candidatus Lokiarchaeota archaeon]|nr:DUF3795 domain-containing protein [Candidatus Lokiarchaeota archaeon]MBD3341341.1 DUF3795 domain-containing protein [Candidatus Lokiarchaeota archaeon]